MAGAGVLGNAAAGRIRLLYTEAGPYRPIGDIPFTSDLTAMGKAPGDLIQVEGSLQDQLGVPLADARITIWQADDNGNYMHVNAPNQSDLVPSFLYRASTVTDGDGAYSFKTIIPGSYEYQGIRRAPHIHFELYLRGACLATTEMYFDGPRDRNLRAQDAVWLSRSSSLRSSLIAAPSSHSPARRDQFKPYRFDLVLDKANGQICQSK